MQQVIKKPASHERTTGYFLKHFNINYSESLPFCKNIPPYGLALLKAINHSYKPTNDLFLYFGELAFNYGKKNKCSHDVLILPPDKKPNQYDWSVVNGQTILGFDTTIQGSGVELIESVAFELLKYGAKIVRTVLVCGQLAIYRKGDDL